VRRTGWRSDLAGAAFLAAAAFFAAGFVDDLPADFVVDLAGAPFFAAAAFFAAGFVVERLLTAGAFLAAVRLATRDVMR
jgi:hypothetical protein